MKHTPGPWRRGKTSTTVVSESALGIDMMGATDESAIEYYGGNLIAESVSANNTALIAAAPEMAEALEAANRALLYVWKVIRHEVLQEAREKVLAALLKAEVRSRNMKIIELRAERFKRLSAVEITPGDGVVVVSGKNGAGKSSVLDAIWLALGGGNAAKSSATTRPVKDGEKDAVVRLDLGEIVVTRKWTSSGGTTLTVEGADGKKFSSPQALLDTLVGSLSFDPQTFSRMPAKDQRKALSDLVHLDVDPEKIDKDRQGAYEERTEVNRELKRFEAKLSTMKAPLPGIPEEEESLSALLEELKRANETQAFYEAERRQLEVMRKQAAALKADIERLRSELASKETELTDLAAAGKAKAEAVSRFVDPDTEALSKRIQGMEATNAAVRAAKEYGETSAAVRSKRTESEALTGRIDDLDRAKEEAFKKAKFPVEGLAFDAEGVTFRGVPFLQCSAAEQMRISIAIAAALNSEIRVIRVSDGSLLDSASMGEVERLAREHDMQVWIERVDESGQVGVVIEDGAVKASRE